MRSLLRIFSFGLICLLLIASSDIAVNVYGHRSGPSTIAAQGTSVINLVPTAYQTPQFTGDSAIPSTSNTGFDGAYTEAYSYGPTSQGKSARWSAFRPVSGQITRITLKVDWSISGELSTMSENIDQWGSANAVFHIWYSTDNGSHWTSALARGESSYSVDGSEDKSFEDSGLLSVDLPANTPINQIQVSSSIYADASSGGFDGYGYAHTIATAAVSNIRLEVETLNCPASVAADRWRGEYYNNINLSGIPPTVRDDGAGFLNFNFGDDPPAGTCGVPSDYFSARWTRTVNFPRGLYRFTATADDGVRLYVDGQMKIDAWVIQGTTTYTADVFLPTGNHEIKLEYFEYTGAASISLNWTTLVNCVAGVPADRWKGEYYNTTTLTGDLAMVRDDGDGFLNFNFGGGSPSSACAVVSDNFSARWTRTVNFAAGTYRFIAAVDNGVKLYVDGQVKIDQWGNLPPNTYTADVTLSAAPHEIKLEFVEYTGDASVILFWADVNCLANVPAGRWRGEYFNNITLSGSPPLGFPAMVRDDGAGFLNFDFGLGSPGAACGIGVDNFSARWTRTVNFAAGTYRFSVTGDDGVRLYVDGQLTTIDKWFSQGATTYTADVALTAGPHQVKLEYFEGGGPGVAFLSWWTVVNGSVVKCLPDVLIGAAPRADRGESIATTPASETPKRCGQKSSE